MEFCNHTSDWLIELSDNNLANELLENSSFLDQPQSRKSQFYDYSVFMEVTIHYSLVLSSIANSTLLKSKAEYHGNNAFCRIVNKHEQSIFPNTEAGEGYYWFHVTIRFVTTPLFLTTILYSAIVISFKRQDKALTNTLPTVAKQRYLTIIHRSGGKYPPLSPTLR